jgi:drug/metabolite transporter (DMT)-like permease
MLAVALSLAAAAAFALAAMLIDQATGRVGALQLVRWQMAMTTALCAVIATATGAWDTLDAQAAGWLAASGLAGIAVGGVTYVAAIMIAGPRLSALLFTMAAPCAVALGYLVRGETVSLLQGAGVALIVGGIALAVAGPGEGAAARAARRHPLWLGVVLGLVTALAQATGSLFARPAMLAGADPVAAMAVRAAVGTAVFVAALAVPAWRPAARPSPAMLGVIGQSALVGMVLGMSLMMAALARGDVGVVTTLTSTTPVLILPMVWLATGRRPAAVAWAGAALAVAGTACLSL